MKHNQKLIRKAERQRKQAMQTRRKRVEKVAPELLKLVKQYLSEFDPYDAGEENWERRCQIQKDAEQVIADIEKE